MRPLVAAIVIVIGVTLLLCGVGYHGFKRHGGPGAGGVLGIIVIVVLVIWLLGGLPFHH